MDKIRNYEYIVPEGITSEESRNFICMLSVPNTNICERFQLAINRSQICLIGRDNALVQKKTTNTIS